MTRPVNIAIVGCGGMGGGHAVALASGTGKAIWNVESLSDPRVILEPGSTDIAPLIHLSGVYDIDPGRNEWARQKGIYVYDSYEAELQDPAVDAILIATPNHLHRDMAIAAMRSGKHVLCEKPVTPSVSELMEILDVSRETGKLFYPRQNRRWDKDYLCAKKIYDQKLLGEIFSIECRITGSRGIPGDWRAQKQHGGGMLLDWGVHILDRLLIMVQEKVKTVYCRLTYATKKECDDGFQMLLTFEGGLTALLEVGTCHFIRHPIWYLAGSGGTAEIEDWACHGRIVQPVVWNDRYAFPMELGEGLSKTMAPRDASSIVELPLPDVEYDRNALYANFAACVQGRETPLITCDEALRTLRLMEAAMRSNQENTVIAFE